MGAFDHLIPGTPTGGGGAFDFLIPSDDGDQVSRSLAQQLPPTPAPVAPAAPQAADYSPEQLGTTEAPTPEPTYDDAVSRRADVRRAAEGIGTQVAKEATGATQRLGSGLLDFAWAQAQQSEDRTPTSQMAGYIKKGVTGGVMGVAGDIAAAVRLGISS